MHFPSSPSPPWSNRSRQTTTQDVRQDSSRVNPVANAWQVVTHHVKRHVGVGIVCAVAYFDPGNWSVDLQAGSEFGYKLLFAVLLAGLGAVVLQALACKLGCVTGLDLAQHCRLLLNNHPKYPRLVRVVFLYPLYVLAETAIISTDLAELLGSAIGLVLLFPRLPLPVAVLLTATDVVFILALGDTSKHKGRPVRVFEFIIITLVLIVFISFIVLIAKVKPYWPEVFKGYLPSHALIEPSGLYTAIGILGATVMPHALFLGSYLATQDRVSTDSVSQELSLPPPAATLSRAATFKKVVVRLFSITRAAPRDGVDLKTPYGERDNKPLIFIKAHLKHGVWDIVMSLLGFAVVINSAILVLAGAVFFFGPGKTASDQAAGLFDAHDLIRQYVGKFAAFIFALALICSGQSASITATLAGQIVSEGFIEWSVSPFLRRLITRLLGLIPSMIVAVAIGRAGIDTLLVISQVVLSVVLPFVMFPLIWLTSSSTVMRVPKEVPTASKTTLNAGDDKFDETSDEASDDIRTVANLPELPAEDDGEIKEEKSVDDDEKDTKENNRIVKVKNYLRRGTNTSSTLAKGEDDYIDYSNGWVLATLCYVIWLVVVVANGYLIVTLAIG